MAADNLRFSAPCSAMPGSRKQQASLRAALTKVNAEIAGFENDARELEARGNSGVGPAMPEKNEKEAENRRKFVRKWSARRRIREILGRLGERVDPCDADPALPLVLLPVRLETRYTEDGAALRIRIFPDDIHVDQLDRGLSKEEIAAGKAYWAAAAAGEQAADAAWTLATTVHEDRAAWLPFCAHAINLDAVTKRVARSFPTSSPARAGPPCRAFCCRIDSSQSPNKSNSRGSAVGAVIAPEVVVGILADDSWNLGAA